MKEILRFVDEQGYTWRLREHALDSRVSGAYLNDDGDASARYWLIRPADTSQPLMVDTPSETTAGVPPSTAIQHAMQMFCLTREMQDGVVATPVAPLDASASAAPPLPVGTLGDGESPQIGTQLLWEDSLVRIWEFRLASGKSCPYHRHLRPYFFLNLTPSYNQELDAHGRDVANTLPSRQAAGQCTYVERSRLGAHAVRNVGDTLFLQFVVEFQSPATQPTAASSSLASTQLSNPTTVMQANNSPHRSANPALIGFATACLIAVGILLNFVMFTYPTLLWLFIPPQHQCNFFTMSAVFLVQVTHATLLWNDPAHLAAYRFLTRPLRRAVLPLVMYLVHMDAIQEAEDVACYILPSKKVSGESNGNGRVPPDTQGLSPLESIQNSFRPSVRRRHKKMRQLFRRQGIHIQFVPCEEALHLRTTVPVLWAHQQRQAAVTGRNVIVEFIKRFLVVSVVPDGVLDLFTHPDDGRLLAFQMGILQGPVYHWFMYFCRDEGRTSGIWFTGVFLSMVRAQSIEGVRYVCGLTHHLDSKRNAGFDVVSHQNGRQLTTLFPFQTTDVIPDEAIAVSVVDENE